MHSGSGGGGNIDTAALQQFGTMFPFDPLGASSQLEALTHVIIQSTCPTVSI